MFTKTTIYIHKIYIHLLRDCFLFYVHLKQRSPINFSVSKFNKSQSNQSGNTDKCIAKIEVFMAFFVISCTTKEYVATIAAEMLKINLKYLRNRKSYSKISISIISATPQSIIKPTFRRAVTVMPLATIYSCEEKPQRMFILIFSKLSNRNIFYYSLLLNC